MILSSSFRRAKALIAFQSSPLLKTILNVSQLDPAFWIKEPEKDVKLNLADFNESQQKVIIQCSSILKSDEPKLCFVQGPPGTGKSHTIVGIINALFTKLYYLRRLAAKQPKVNEKNLNLKIMICSPSNGGCDELTRRIKKLKEQTWSAIYERVLQREAKVVRVGRTESIHKDCEEMTLDFLYKKAFDQLMMEKKTTKSESLTSHYKNLQFHEKKFTIRVKEFKTSGKEKQRFKIYIPSDLNFMKKKLKKNNIKI
ncbi:putative helicase senataxin [Brachionus plicatilis]|uniref:Putative helicase senataxin n=1 Tax=Brachionus plicatilis TaxID=10195 RepID=A0A3M7RTM2_BRAPC|nr:putative helicase senataxin [Brachionus plicatilis]